MPAPLSDAPSGFSSGKASPHLLEQALKRGTDGLMNLAAHVLDDKPHALARARERYRPLRGHLYRPIERARSKP